MLKFIDRVEKIVSNKEDDVVTVSHEESTIAA